MNPKAGNFILCACLVIGILFLSTENAFSQTVSGITTGRARSIVTAVAGLISLIIGWRAKIRSGSNTGAGRSGAITALVLGVICVIASTIHLITATSAFGTGSGKAGAIVAFLLGIAGIIFSGLALRPKKI